MQSFTIHPKKGEPFTLEFDRFELRDSEFVLYNDFNKESRAGYLSLENIAAIIPHKLPEVRSNIIYDAEPIIFSVYLKGRPATEPIEIPAYSCDTSQPHSIKFFAKLLVQNKFQDQVIPNIYIATSEVVAIMPSAGLQSKS